VLTDGEIEWLRRFVADAILEFGNSYVYLWNNLPRIVDDEVRRIEDEEELANVFSSRATTLLVVSGLVLEDALEVVRIAYGEKIYLALALGIPCIMGATAIYGVEKQLNVPEDTMRSDVAQYLEELWRLIQSEDGGIDGMIHLAFEAQKGFRPIRSALDLVNALKFSDVSIERDAAKVIEVTHSLMDKCTTGKDPYRRLTCIVGVATAALTTYLAELVNVAPAESRAGLAAAAVMDSLHGVINAIAGKKLYRPDELKAKVAQLLPAVKRFVEYRVADLLR